ncbi:MAG: Activator of Hsp90 ATPase 1 family protein [Chitinophagaceae bacterium]|nr:Activator of Hsp90 ATPase 1 family protein [Chitinophagaceae bacterium]
MKNTPSTSSTHNSKLIRATPEKIYQALTDPKALETWLAPGDMYGEVHYFDLRIGGRYRMSLFYPSSETSGQGKTSANEDQFTARFVELIPPHKISQAILFNSTDPAYAGEMIMEVSLQPKASGTEVTFLFKNIPSGIRPEDNEKGTEQSLEKLARYVE